jgi:hypothetical protein
VKINPSNATTVMTGIKHPPRQPKHPHPFLEYLAALFVESKILKE